MLTKSRRALAASALALTAVAGGSFVVVRVLSPAPAFVVSAGLPSPAGSPATATVPRGPGGADGAGAPAGTGPAASGGALPALPRSAGQGDPGPLPAGALPADGAVPGASPAIQAQAAARAATTALPHSPRLLAELAGTAGAPGAAGTQAAQSPAASPTGSAQETSDPATPTPPAPATPAPMTPAPVPSSPAPSGPTPSSPATSGPAAPDPTAPVPAATVPATAPPPTAPPSTTPPPPSASPPVGSPSPAPTMPAPTTPAPTASPTASGPSPSVLPRAAKALAGLDVAAFQHPDGEAIAWTSVAAAGYKFAAVKATEGDYYVNPWAATDLAAAKAAGLDATPYHFAVPNVSSGSQQAQFAVEYSGYASGPRTLPLMLDIEYDPYVSTDHTNECYGLSAAGMTAWVAAFVATARSLTGQYPVIYTTANWWDTCTGGSTAFAADPMWVAAYGAASPPVPAGWHAWTFWQYTSDGTVRGVASPGGTDLDTFSPSVVGLIDPGAQSGPVGTRVSLQIGSLGAAAGESLRYAATGLPPGLTAGAGGAISGTVATSAAPSVSKTYRVTVTVKNAGGATATATFTWQVKT